MIRVKIKNKATQEYTHGADFASQELADAWVAEQIAKGAKCAWGRPAWTKQVPILDEQDEPVVDEQGESAYNEIEHEDEFTIEIEDLGDAHLMAEIRRKRDALLAASDFAVLPDAPLSEAKKAEYVQYRQDLRDLPANADVTNPTYPSKPE